MIFAGINCGDLSGKQCSEKLDGALSANQEFFYVNMIVNDIVGPGYKHVGIFSHKNIKAFVPTGVVVDEENDIIISKSGAVVDAYDLSDFNDEEFKRLTGAILEMYSNTYPGYKFALVEEQFPLGVEGSLTIVDGQVTEEKPIMSSHVLVIENYSDYLKTNKAVIKK